MYNVVDQEYLEVQCSFTFYCKFTGQLKKLFSVRGFYFDFVIACERDLIVIQQHYPDGMKIIDISSEVPRLIKSYLHSVGNVIYLDRKCQLICKIMNRCTNKDSVGAFNLAGERSITFRDLPDFLLFSCTTKNQDVAIFVSMAPLSINVNSILTGKSLANFGVNDSINSWIYYWIKWIEHSKLNSTSIPRDWN